MVRCGSICFDRTPAYRERSDQGVMSGLLTGTAFTNQFPEINTTTGNGSDTLQGLVVAIYEIGCFAGSLFCLFAGESLGRKNCIWLGCLILSIGAALQTTAYGIPQMIVGRIVAGVGNGMNTSTIREFRTCAGSSSRSTLTRNSCLACGAHASP
jgi:MFS family permease